VSQFLCELGSGYHFNLVSEPSDHLAEDPDFFFVVAASYQNIGRIPQRSCSTFRGSPQDQLV